MTKNLLISGCSTGIGRACALHFAKTGYHVFACVRKESDAESLKAADDSGNLEPVMLDVTNELQLGELKAELNQRIGDTGLAGLINNAGIAKNGPIEYIDPQAVRDVFNVNVMGPLLLTQAFLPLVRVAKGRIVTIGSIAGKVASPTMAAYSISKFGIEAFSDSLRQELAPHGIHVSLVEPGPIETPMLQPCGRNWSASGPNNDKSPRSWRFCGFADWRRRCSWDRWAVGVVDRFKVIHVEHGKG